MYVLLLIITLLLQISYYIFRKDFASPTFLFYIGYFIAAIAATYNITTWKIDIQDNLIAIFIIGWISFFLGELFTRELLYKEKGRGYLTDYEGELEIIKIEEIKIWIVLLIDFAITYLLYREVVRIAGLGGSFSLSMMANYKTNLMENSMSGLVIQTTKFTKGAAYIFLFIFANNIIAEERVTGRVIVKNLKYLYPGIIYCIQCLLRGGRYTVIAYIIALIFNFYFFAQYKYGWAYQVKLKTMIKMMCVVFGIFIAFWLLKETVGRTSSATFLEYISQYIGGPYELFSLYLKDRPSAANETFAGLLTSFNKMGLTDVAVRTYHEFRFTSNNIMLGNVYTGFRTYYNDYGIIGVGLLSFLLSLIFNIAYHKLRFVFDIYHKKFLMILYSSLLYCIVFNFFVDYFYARLSIGYFVEVLIMYITYLFVFRTKIKKGIIYDRCTQHG